MNVPKLSAAWSLIAKVFLSSIAIFLCVTVLIGIYFMGFLSGYNKGVSDIEKLLLNNIDAEVTTAPTIILTSTPKPQTITEVTPKPVIPQVSWGGPELWEEVNKKRREKGVNPLLQRDELCTIASIRLNELLELEKLDGHEGFSNLSERRPDLEWIFEKYSVVAEFLAVGGDTPQETVSLWENTLGHKKLLDGGEYVWGCIYAQNTFAVAITAY